MTHLDNKGPVYRAVYVYIGIHVRIQRERKHEVKEEKRED